MKLIPTLSKLGRALRVIALLEDKLSKFADLPLFVDTYCNCREQGFCICLPLAKHNYSFSEYRNADFLICYKMRHNRSTDGNKPNEEEYRNSREFQTEEELAEYLYNEILLELQLTTPK